MHVTAIHKMNRDGYRDQIVTCEVGVSLSPLFLHVYYSCANQELNFLTYRENTIRRPMYKVH